MNKMAKLLSWCYGLAALIFVLVPLSNLWQRLPSNQSLPTERLATGTTAAATLITLAAIFGMAWWTTRTGRPYARVWAIAASVIQIALGNILVIIRRGPPIWLMTLLGVAGLIVFSHREAVAYTAARSPKSDRLPGDGTNRFIDAAAQIAGVAGALVSFSWWARWAQARRLPAHNEHWFLLLIVLAYFIAVAVHECGHVAAGLALGMKLRGFVVGPFHWQIRRGEWEFRFEPTGVLSVDGAAGLVHTTIADWRWRDIYMTAAGPFASLLLGTAALWAALNAKGRPWERFWEILAYIGVISLVTFVVNLIPIRPEAHYSDGARILQLLSNGPWADVHRAFSMVTSSLVTPLRPKDFDLPTIQRAAGLVTRGREALLLRMFAYLHFLDCESIPEAVHAMQEAELIYEQSASDIPADLHLDFVFANALLRNDPMRARLWWERMESRKPRRNGADYELARSALAWAERRPEEAREAWVKADAAAQLLPKAGAYEFMRYRSRQLRQLLDTPSS